MTKQRIYKVVRGGLELPVSAQDLPKFLKNGWKKKREVDPEVSKHWYTPKNGGKEDGYTKNNS